MIQFMGSDETIAILEWIRREPFTRANLQAYLTEIGYADPFAGAHALSPIDRIMGTIKRSAFASCSGRTWTPNEKMIDQAIDMNRRDPIKSAMDSYREIAGKASSFIGGPVDLALVDQAAVKWGEERRSSRKTAAI